MEIRYSEKAVKQITKINKGDRKSAEMIIKSLDRYSENPSGNFDVKVLKANTVTLKGCG